MESLTLLADPPTTRIPEHTVHSGESACLLRACVPNSEENVEVLFSEFCDPGGRETYFPISDPDIAVDDELLVRSGLSFGAQNK